MVERLIAVRNQRGERYRLIRDALGQIVEEIDYWGQARSYRYSPAGYIQEMVDPLGRTICYKTDALGRVLEKSIPDPFSGERLLTHSYSYDANGDFVTAVNAHDREGFLSILAPGATMAASSASTSATSRFAARIRSIKLEPRTYCRVAYGLALRVVRNPAHAEEGPTWPGRWHSWQRFCRIDATSR